MILKTQEFQKVASTIVGAIDKNAGSIELFADGQNPELYLSASNKEYYCRVAFPLNEPAFIHAVVDAQLFLSLISGLTTDTFEITTTPNAVTVKTGKSKYKLSIIFDNNKMLEIPAIEIKNKTVEMNIGKDILTSISNINGKEISKVRGLDINELQKLYYITENGCFTFTTGACLNKFTLDKPVNLLLNDRIVKLFKLFKDDVKFSMGFDSLSDTLVQTKVCFEADGIYLAAITACNDILLSKVQKPCEMTKNFINEPYDNHLVINAAQMSAAIARLMMFTKNSGKATNMLSVPATISFANGEMTISDNDNEEVVSTLNEESSMVNGYSMIVNLADLKAILDSCKDGTITMNCGNHRVIVFTRGNINWLVSEGIKA